ncbi:hypothetical protein VNO77_34378 [Canavalia gladiata]|uniref:Uncharacterized protein n=1 Tax=Canavalia gladiata TaxID=3824 RepID=A0AAN9PX66_CANGL
MGRKFGATNIKTRDASWLRSGLGGLMSLHSKIRTHPRSCLHNIVSWRRDFGSNNPTPPTGSSFEPLAFLNSPPKAPNPHRIPVEKHTENSSLCIIEPTSTCSRGTDLALLAMQLVKEVQACKCHDRLVVISALHEPTLILDNRCRRQEGHAEGSCSPSKYYMLRTDLVGTKGEGPIALVLTPDTLSSKLGYMTPHSSPEYKCVTMDPHQETSQALTKPPQRDITKSLRPSERESTSPLGDHPLRILRPLYHLERRIRWLEALVDGTSSKTPHVCCEGATQIESRVDFDSGEPLAWKTSREPCCQGLK